MEELILSLIVLHGRCRIRASCGSDRVDSDDGVECYAGCEQHSFSYRYRDRRSRGHSRLRCRCGVPGPHREAKT